MTLGRKGVRFMVSEVGQTDALVRPLIATARMNKESGAGEDLYDYNFITAVYRFKPFIPTIIPVILT